LESELVKVVHCKKIALLFFGRDASILAVAGVFLPLPGCWVVMTLVGGGLVLVQEFRNLL
jgi:hypothetical protein